MNAQLENHTAALLEGAIAGRYPDARGRYGPFGGRYVPETLVAPLERLAAACGLLRDERFLAEFHAELASWAGRPTALTQARGLSRRWGAEVWLEARGSRPYRRAQDQQRDRPGAARAAPRREARDRRDRRRTAWGRDRRGLREARHALHGLYGRARHGAPGTERWPHAAARCHGRRGREWRPHAARRR